MSPERQYNEQEIAAIFKQAAADQESAQRKFARSGGLTLAEIEQIGKEAGITPEFIARAAASVGQSSPAPPPTRFLGFPISVGHTVELPGPFTDEDWDRLVVDLRETFQAPGEVRRDGSLRQWRNGNLHALIEPTESGHRLRFRTLSESLRGALGGSLMFFLMGLFFMLLVAAKGDFAIDWGKTLFVSMFAVAGLGGLGVTAFRLPRWRAERERQMEAIAARTLSRASSREATATRTEELSPQLDLDLEAEHLAEVGQQRMPQRL